MRGGERWPGGSAGDAARFSPPRRSKPLRPGAPPRASPRPLWRRAIRIQPNGCHVRQAPSGGQAADREERPPEMDSPPGAERSKPNKHRARDARTWWTCGSKILRSSARSEGGRHASMSRGVEARGSPGTPGVPRALFFLRGARFGLRRTRRRKKTRAMNRACSYFYPPLEGEGRTLER